MKFFSAMKMKARSHHVTIRYSHSESKPVPKLGNYGDLFNTLTTSCIGFPVAFRTLIVKVDMYCSVSINLYSTSCNAQQSM